jgi:hypothetical protein
MSQQNSSAYSEEHSQERLQLREYVTVLTPSTLVSKSGIKGARERNSAQTGGGGGGGEVV